MPKDKIIAFIDFFYPLFRRIMPLQTFRYAVCGGSNTVLGLAIYFVSYNYLFNAKNFHFGFFAFKPHIASLFVSFVINFIVGFLLLKYVVFVDSNIKVRIQAFRYFLSFSVNLVINYGLLKLFVEVMDMPAFPSQLTTTGILIIFSFITQKYFTFKVKPE